MKNGILIAIMMTIVLPFANVTAQDRSLLSESSLTSIVTANPRSRTDEPSLTVTAEFSEETTVIKIELYYRAIGASRYKIATMHANKNGDYRYNISKSELDYPGLEYYIMAFDFTGDSLMQGNKNLPLVANLADGWNENLIAARTTFGSNFKNRIAIASSFNQSGSPKDSLLKNKWLWIGVGLLAVAVISNDSDDEEPGFSLTVEAPLPAPEPANR